MNKKIAIVHFHPLEKYPPVMNLITDIKTLGIFQILVFSINNINKFSNWFNFENVKIFRFGRLYGNKILRYCTYLQYNILAFFCLLLNKPNILIAFETYSIIPVYLYKKIFPKTILFVHYHEYTSLEEVKNSSIYLKFLNSIEKKLFLNCDWVSHTNEDRLNFFLKDYPSIKNERTFFAPNLPPADWYFFARKYESEIKTHPFKLVHVGALSLETMYLSDIVDWVIIQNGNFILDFYTDNITDDAVNYLKLIDSKYVNLFESINYFKLPEVLIKYDIGLTLYNGYIPNHIYSVPNKVYEYLACGLQVWYSKDLLTTDRLNINSNNIENDTLIPSFLKLLHFNDYYSHEKIFLNKILSCV
jgi:hypothetical protein